MCKCKYSNWIRSDMKLISFSLEFLNSKLCRLQIHLPQSFKQTKFWYSSPFVLSMSMVTAITLMKHFNESLFKKNEWRIVENIKDINKIVKYKRRMLVRVWLMGFGFWEYGIVVTMNMFLPVLPPFYFWLIYWFLWFSNCLS